MGDEKPRDEGADELPGREQQPSEPVDATAPIPSAGTDDFTEITPADDAAASTSPDHTVVVPPEAWSGRAEVPGGGLRGSAPHQDEPTARYREAAYGEGPYAGEPPKPRTWWTPLLLGLLALALIALVALAAWLISRDGTATPEPTPTPQPIVPTSAVPATPRTSAPSPTPSAAPELIEVPVLVGDRQDDAIAKLDAVGLSYRLEFRSSDLPIDRVVETNPASGELVPPRTTITLVISRGQGQTQTPTPTASAEPDND